MKLEQRARETFWFLEPRDLFADYPDGDRTGPDNEADLVCVVDGKVFLCEVKNSDREIKVGPLMEMAKRMRPDRVILAVFDSETSRLKSKADNLAHALRDTGVSSELLAPEDGDLDSLSILPGYLE